jgi:multidrug efflux pump subunit AcrA (membrane-fusion protein)
MIYAKKSDEKNTVKVDKVGYVDIYDSAYYGGRIEPFNTIKQYSSINGIVERIYVKEGDRVKSGGVICMIVRKISSDNYKPLIVRAVNDGIVVNLKITEQMEVFDKSELFSIADDTKYKVVIFASDKEIINIKLNDPCFIKGSSIKGFVSSVSILPKDTTGLFVVEVTFLKQKELFIGKFVSLELRTNLRKALIVPQKSLIKKYGKIFLFIIDKNKAKLREIKTGNNFNDYIEIIDGLRENDVYIVAPFTGLNDGDDVLIRKE